MGVGEDEANLGHERLGMAAAQQECGASLSDAVAATVGLSATVGNPCSSRAKLPFVRYDAGCSTHRLWWSVWSEVSRQGCRRSARNS